MALREHSRLTGSHRRILLFAWFAWLTGFYSLMLLSFLLVPIQEEFALTSSALAWLTGIGVGMTGVGGFLFGWMSDRYGRRGSLVAAIAAFSIGNALSGLAPDATGLILARALTGLGIGGTWGAGQAMLGETFPARLRGRYGAVAQSGAPLGLALAAILGAFAAPVLGWRITFGISSLPLLMIFAVWPRLPESDLWQEHRQAQRAARPILAQLLASDLAGRFIRAFILTALNMSAYWFAIIWLPLYLQEERGLSIFGSGWWTLIFVVGSLAGYLSFGQVSDRIGRRLAFTAYCLVKAAALALVAFLPAGPAAGSLGLVFMFVAGIGTGTWSCYGPYFSELFPTRVRGAALSVTMNVTRGVQFLTPLVIAAVAPRWGLAGGVGLAAAFAALAAAWIWTLPETAGRALDVEHHHHARA